MNDSVLSRYASAIRAEPGRQGRDEELVDQTDDLGAFGWLRGPRERAVMLELRKRDGNSIALSYALLERAEFDPSIGITLFFMGQGIVIRGRNLNQEVRPSVRLYEGILRHRVTWLRETHDRPVASDGPETVVSAIEV